MRGRAQSTISHVQREMRNAIARHHSLPVASSEAPFRCEAEKSLHHGTFAIPVRTGPTDTAVETPRQARGDSMAVMLSGGALTRSRNISTSRNIHHHKTSPQFAAGEG